jgi:hypothetical protein
MQRAATRPYFRVDTSRQPWLARMRRIGIDYVLLERSAYPRHWIEDDYQRTPPRLRLVYVSNDFRLYRLDDDALGDAGATPVLHAHVLSDVSAR